MLAPLLFLKEEIKIIEQHHEWVDGFGYPHGIKGNDIHPLAKILAVADAYEAMTADRPYRKNLGYREAIRQLEEGKDRQFEKQAVECFIAMMERRRYYLGERGMEEFEFGVETGA